MKFKEIIISSLLTITFAVMQASALEKSDSLFTPYKLNYLPYRVNVNAANLMQRERLAQKFSLKASSRRQLF